LAGCKPCGCAVRNGRVVEMQAFADRQEALRWVGAEAERDR
jgi:hypothetical protein